MRERRRCPRKRKRSTPIGPRLRPNRNPLAESRGLQAKTRASPTIHRCSVLIVDRGCGPESAAHRSVEQGPRLRGCDRAGAHESRAIGAPSVALRGRIQAQYAWNLLRPPRDASLLDWPIFWILPASSASQSPILDRNAHVFHYVRRSKGYPVETNGRHIKCSKLD